MKKLFFILLFILLAFIGSRYIYVNKKPDHKIIVVDRINSQVNEVKKIISNSSKYNKDIAFFIDMKVPSGKKIVFLSII